MILTKLDSATGLLAPSTSSKITESTALPITENNMPEIAMVAIKVYAFGGLAFMVAVILTAITYWFWTVLVRREFADSPPSLELHPEQMRARERARTLRLKMRKEKRKQGNSVEESDAFTPPPVRYTTKTRPRTTSLPVKPALRDSILEKPQQPNVKDSQSPNKGCGKRVSWASTLTLGNNQDSSELEKATSNCEKHSASPSLSNIQNVSITPLPPAQTTTPRLSTAIEARSRRGQEMIAATTPEVSTAWARSDAPVARTSAICKCYESIDPLDTRSHYCEVHSYRV